MKKSQLKLFLKKIVTEAKLLENIQDPSKDEMFNYLRQMYGNEEGFRDDAEVAIYWFANFYHGGQSSNLYSVLSTSRFSPGPIAKGPEPHSSEEMMYEDLVLKFAPGTEEANKIQHKHNSLNEAVDSKTQEKIEKWIRELGTRKTAYKIVGIMVRKRTGIDIEDMADTATLASGVDSVEQVLVKGDFEQALRAAFEAAKEFFDEEAGEGLFEGEEGDAVNDMWAGSDDEMSQYKQPRNPQSKQKSKKFFSKKPKAKTVQDFDWASIKQNIDKGTLKENDGTPSLIDGQSNAVAAGRVNKVLGELSKGIFSDDSWQAINKIFEKLNQLGLEVNILSAKYGGQQDTSNNMPKYKEWQISIPFTNKAGKPMELVGQITAHGAGSVQQPLDRYDITAYVSAIPKRA